MPNVREVIRDELAARVPSSWRIVDWQADAETLDSLTLIVSISRIRRADAAPQGAFDVTVTVTLVSPIVADHRAAEAELETALDLLIEHIEDAFGMGWDEATKATYAEQYLCWDIPVHYIGTRSTTPTPSGPAPLTA